jgi:hypothetical protein
MLCSLLAKHSFHIVGLLTGVRLFHELQRTTDPADLIVLSGGSVEQALRSAAVMSAARLDSKVVFLFDDDLSWDDMRQLCESVIDGCISLKVSDEVLLRSIDFVVSDSVRLFAFDEEATTRTGQNGTVTKTPRQQRHGYRRHGAEQTSCADGAHPKDDLPSDADLKVALLSD